MTLDTWLRLPSPDWAGNLLNLSLAVVSASAAIYSSAVLPWVAALQAAIRAMSDADGQPLDGRTSEGARARRRLHEVRGRDPARGLGVVSLAISIPMSVFGVIAGLQIPNTGLLFTVVPVLIAAAVAVGAAFLPGRGARRDADKLLLPD